MDSIKLIEDNSFRENRKKKDKEELLANNINNNLNRNIYDKNSIINSKKRTIGDLREKAKDLINEHKSSAEKINDILVNLYPENSFKTNPKNKFKKYIGGYSNLLKESSGNTSNLKNNLLNPSNTNNTIINNNSNNITNQNLNNFDLLCSNDFMNSLNEEKFRNLLKKKK